MIFKIEQGWVNDDLLMGRITLKVFISPRVYLPYKLYKNGRLTSVRGVFDDEQEHEIEEFERVAIMDALKVLTFFE